MTRFSILSLGLLACLLVTACQAGPVATPPLLLPSPPPEPSPTPKASGLELLTGEAYPGVDLGLEAGAAYALPDEVGARLKEMGGIPILTNGNRAGSSRGGVCKLPMPELLVSGSKLQQAADGTAPFAFNGDGADQTGVWKLPVEGDLQCAAFVAKTGNQWGLEAGTVAVWFFEGGGKAGTRIINPDNPLRVLVDAENTVDVRLENGQVVFTTIGPDGSVIEEQSVDLSAAAETGVGADFELAQGLFPDDFEGADAGEKLDKALAALPEVPGDEDTWWLDLEKLALAKYDSGEIEIGPNAVFYPLLDSRDSVNSIKMGSASGIYLINYDWSEAWRRPFRNVGLGKRTIRGVEYVVIPVVWANANGQRGVFIGLAPKERIKLKTDLFLPAINGQDGDARLMFPNFFKDIESCMGYPGASGWCEWAMVDNPEIFEKYGEAMPKWAQTGVPPENMPPGIVTFKKSNP